MKLSVNWIKEYLAFELPKTDELVKKIGAQLGEVEGVQELGSVYDKVLVAKVVSCVDHPNADRLHVCVIDDGGKAQNVTRNEQGNVQVVCGAPNVREGLTVAWLPPGSTVPESVGKDPFVLEARELRGVISNGMLASPKELALGDSHEGILELDADKQAGQSFADAYGLDDVIIDIENKMFTHRPDLFGELGLAREIAGITGQAFTSPDWYKKDASLPATETEVLPLTIENELPSLVPRFAAVVLDDIKVAPSPVWLQAALTKVGIRPISNIVDYTNYFMMLTGQPLHAYDYDKVRSLSGGDHAAIVVRNPREGEKVALLNGKSVDPRQEAIMIATNKQLIGLAGVMGGADTEVDDTTTRIILESASFDMYSVRRTSMEHGLFSDAVTRFSKGQSPLQCRAVLVRIVEEIRAHAGGKIASDIIDISQVEGRDWVHPPVPLAAHFVNTRLGLSLSPSDMQTLLQNVEFNVSVDGDALVVTAPFWRTDIETREDIVEEVGRLYGFDKLPLELPLRSIKPVQKNADIELKTAVREMLVKCGANEVLTYSFVHGNLLQKVGQDPAQAFRLSNALSPDLQYYRLSLTPSLLDKVHPNIKAGYDQFALFELGKSHHISRADAEGLPAEDDILALTVASDDKRPMVGAAFYQAKAYLDSLADSLGVAFEYVPVTEFADQQEYKPFVANRSALIRNRRQDKVVGVIGEYTSSTRKSLKLPAYTAGFEILLSGLVAGELEHRYEPLSRYPKLEQDVTLRVSDTVLSGALTALIADTLAAHKPEHTHLSLENLGIYAAKTSDKYRSHSFRIRMVNFERTMTADELSRLIDEVVKAAQQKFVAERT